MPGRAVFLLIFICICELNNKLTAVFLKTALLFCLHQISLCYRFNITKISQKKVRLAFG